MMSRAEFINHIELLYPNLNLFDDDSVVWAYEKYIQRKSEWFIVVPREIDYNDNGSEYYWEWCKEHLSGEAICYSSSDDEQWWGFTDKDDVALWVLKWS